MPIEIKKCGQLIDVCGSKRLWRITLEGLPQETYIVEGLEAEKLLLNRQLTGRSKFKLIQLISQGLVDMLARNSTIIHQKQPRQFLIMRGARPMDLQNPSKTILPSDNLPTSITRLKRELLNGVWQVKQYYFDGQWDGKLWLIPETAIASGSTICCLLKQGFQHHRPEAVIIFTVAGSLGGIRKINELCCNQATKLVVVFSQCAFQVSKTGVLPNLPDTDLPILNPQTIASREFVAKARIVYQDTMMCSVGDVGESLWNPKNYLKDTVEEAGLLGIDISKDPWTWIQDWRQK